MTVRVKASGGGTVNVPAPDYITDPNVSADTQTPQAPDVATDTVDMSPNTITTTGSTLSLV